ncbi:hypothetical protein GW17_00050495 [Ensete ventricosum]|nr:hypothetical protein GW17_00050495 [Ensete ventricosum]
MLITTLPATAGELIFFFLLRSPAVVSHPMFATFSGTPRRFPYAADAASGICAERSASIHLSHGSALHPGLSYSKPMHPCCTHSLYPPPPPSDLSLTSSPSIHPMSPPPSIVPTPQVTACTHRLGSFSLLGAARATCSLGTQLLDVNLSMLGDALTDEASTAPLILAVELQSA